MMAQLARINACHVSLCSAFVPKMQATPDGDRTLLDRSLILSGGGLGDGNGHTHFNLPAVRCSSAGRRCSRAGGTSAARSRRR